MKRISLFITLLIISVFSLVGCMSVGTAESASGVKIATTKVNTDSNGHTSEQNNIKERLLRDNKPGSIKFLYIVSPYTGDLIMQSTVKGKVTSSGKRLTPSDLTEVTGVGGTSIQKYIQVDGRTFSTDQTPSDDGTYGDSIPYLYWFDQNDVYHQAYTGGVMVHITDQPQTFYKTTQRTRER